MRLPYVLVIVGIAWCACLLVGFWLAGWRPSWRRR